MSKFDEVTRRFGSLKYMDEARAVRARALIAEHGCADLLEIGFHKGKSSAYFAAMLEDQGRGHLTTIDRMAARAHQPGIGDVLGELGLSHRVTPIFAERSHTWELARMLEAPSAPRFDFCYFDGGHTWDTTGFGLVLVDMLLKPGGVLLVDDLNWSINRSVTATPGRAKAYEGYSEDEKAAQGVDLAFRTILPHLGYRDLSRVEFSWGVAIKPTDRAAAPPVQIKSAGLRDVVANLLRRR